MNELKNFAYGADDTVDVRPINTIQTVMDNAHYGDTMIVYQDGDRQVVVNEELPKRYLYPTTPGHRAAVKVPRGKKIMIFDGEERKAIALGPEEVYDFLNECGGPFDEINCTPEQQKQIIEYFRSMGCKIDDNGMRQKPMKIISIGHHRVAINVTPEEYTKLIGAPKILKNRYDETGYDEISDLLNEMTEMNDGCDPLWDFPRDEMEDNAIEDNGFVYVELWYAGIPRYFETLIPEKEFIKSFKSINR